MTDMIYDYQVLPDGGHMWTLRGPFGGVHIWARLLGVPSFFDDQKFYGGVEVHSPKPVYSWETEDEPHHKNCFLLKGPCWHVGSSLYFSEYIAPMLTRFYDEVSNDFPDAVREQIYACLCEWYRDHFEKDDG